MRSAWAMTMVMLACGAVFAETGMVVEDSGGDPVKRVVTVTSPGVYRVEVWHASGGGLNRFYNLAIDPEAKMNLAERKRGLFEIGWHGAGYKGPDREDCCIKHILNKKRFVKDPKTGEMVRDRCYDGCADWPSIHHGLGARKRKDPKVAGTLEVIERSPARVRAGDVPFMWWHKYVHDLKVTGTYTFYPTGTIVIQVHIENPGERAFHWSYEHGPHLFFPSNKEDKPVPDFIFGTPQFDDYTVQTKGLTPRPPVAELVMGHHPARASAFFLTIPTEAHKFFPRHMRHTFKGVWDRYGYGSRNIVMQPGYDETWACMIQLCSRGGKVAPSVNTPKAALPLALQYREPAKITGATLVTDDDGDLNRDGFNESEGCHVLKGPGPLTLTYEKGKGAGFAPVFKVTAWQGDAPKMVKIDDKDVPCVAGVVDGRLILQVLGTVTAEKANIEIGG